MVEPAITQITLTQKEKQIFTTLLNVVDEYKLKTTLRVAGGWVRDKVSDYYYFCLTNFSYWARKVTILILRWMISTEKSLPNLFKNF